LGYFHFWNLFASHLSQATADEETADTLSAPLEAVKIGWLIMVNPPTAIQK
jgi:hypothetical protein